MLFVLLRVSFLVFTFFKVFVHDIHYLQDVKSKLSDCMLLADKGYLSTQQQLDLFETTNIKLETPSKKESKNYKKQPCVFRKSKKRIETLFYQLCDQFIIGRNYAKSFVEFKTKILSKIRALTTIQYSNRFIENRNINNLKVNTT